MAVTRVRRMTVGSSDDNRNANVENKADTVVQTDDTTHRRSAEQSVEDVERAAQLTEAKQKASIQQEKARQELALIKSRNQAQLDEQKRVQRRAAVAEEDRQKSEILKRREAERQEREQHEQETYQQEMTKRQKRLEALRDSGVRHSGGALIAFAAVGLIVSMVDITFLQDVLGRILGISTALSTVLSAVIGLSAMIMLMGFQGYKEAHVPETGLTQPWYKKPEVLLWLILGFILMILRIVSGYILELGEDDALLAGTKIRLMDLVTAPIMLILYLGAGLFAMYGIRNFFKSDMYFEMLDNMNNKKSRYEVMRRRHIEEMERKREERELARRQRMQERQEKQRAKAEARESKQQVKAKERESNRLRGEYEDARKVYDKKVEDVHREHERISRQLSRLETSGHDLNNVGGISSRLVNNVNEARSQVQGQVAMLVNAKSHISVDTLNGIIADYNSKHPF